MKRKIIKIDEALCNGCGDCVVGCEEGALKIINGKAKLVRDDFCDGFGNCIGHCPTGALTIEEREAPDFDEEAVKVHIQKQASKFHPPHAHGGCPGSKERVVSSSQKPSSTTTNHGQGHFQTEVAPSELRQWPVQLHLVNPRSEIFDNKEMVILSTCSPITSPDVHWKYIRGRSVVVACPKLDDTDPYIPKLAEIFKNKTIPKAIVVIMEVPCCRGLAQIVMSAHKISGREDLKVEAHIMSLDGKILNIVEA